MKNNFSSLLYLFIFILSGISSNLSYADNKNKTPIKCNTNCVSPYGEVTGISKRGVKAYSNCNSECVIFEPNKLNGTYTGIKWQCVEYARRWLLANRGAVYGDVDIASDIWSKINHLTLINTQIKLDLISYLNGSAVPPKVGDLLIYAQAFNNTGHVAVVIDTNLSNGFIKVAEQNFSNKKWTNNYSRKINITTKDKKYWLLDQYILGWKHIVN